MFFNNFVDFVDLHDHPPVKTTSNQSQNAAGNVLLFFKYPSEIINFSEG